MHAVWAVKGDVKYGIVGEEGECVWGRREDRTLGVVVHGHGHCCRPVLVNCCLCCRAGRNTLTLKKSFSICQQCGCTSANANRKANVKKGDNEGEAMQEAGRGAEGMEGSQKFGRVSSYCASYYEVDCLLTLYVEGWCSQLGGIVVESKLSTDTKSADWRD